eukprot:CAMPEP_0206604600 /NCGR_PEP_ID=MMETSP0325_2-20121206/49531_1 /ASSEMBLY_ACC=CAM_ASM_000347 /TAXON_ID=2866 /ORGANISM="Crypthecodinium cohnii, Strain Seligo" /LENGTH=240 /DNA_ID=CAMNT_0054119213 /DNA_START=181 /DNA_END=905 /DNA_ORIENTATION=-
MALASPATGDALRGSSSSRPPRSFSKGNRSNSKTSRSSSKGLKAETPRPQLYLFGEIEGAVAAYPLVRLYCSWKLHYDSSAWTVVQGDTEGETYLSEVEARASAPGTTQCKPIWPAAHCEGGPDWKLLFAAQIAMGADSSQATAMVSASNPGNGRSHVSMLATVRPRPPGSPAQLPPVPELLHSSLISDSSSTGNGTSKGRLVLRTEDSVDVLFRLNLVHQYFEENGLFVSLPPDGTGPA